MELHGHGLLDDERIVLGDLRDRRAMDALMARVRPHVVLHAAAHKHLPLLERYPVEGLRTNVLGTVNGPAHRTHLPDRSPLAPWLAAARRIRRSVREPNCPPWANP
ncbi:polysaccharide biosynthesis protein [Streptomyces sp. NPDC003374]